MNTPGRRWHRTGGGGCGVLQLPKGDPVGESEGGTLVCGAGRVSFQVCMPNLTTCEQKTRLNLGLGEVSQKELKRY
jgi:hypothetical protein